MSTIIKTKTISHTHDHQLPSQLHPIIQRIFLNRGVTQSNELERGLNALIPFHLLKGIEDAVALIHQAFVHRKRILIIGDFDADGATSSALAVQALKAMGAGSVQFLVPNRFEYGYGLTPEIVTVALNEKPDLLITVDNGISSLEGVRFAKEQGLQVLVTDHHLPGHQLPDADAIVNPNQPGCEFPSKNLAGVGVIFYVMLALRSHLRQSNWFDPIQRPEPNLGELLDLVALGTYADVVPLDHNNRILVYQGLKRIQNGFCRPGILALLKIAGRDPKTISAKDLGFAIGPRLNAAGRLDDMALGIECLLSPSMDAAMEMAKLLDELNHERRSIEVSMKKEAFQFLHHLDEHTLPTGICLFEEDWHQGVIGIVAGRVKDQFHRPTIAFAAVNEDELKGSARSIEGLHIRDVLDEIASQHPDILKKFGGHAMAAGLSLKRKDYARFAQIFDETVQSHLSAEHLKKQLLSDGVLETEHFNLPLAELIREHGPYGQAFPEPLFDGHFEIVSQRLLNGKHLKLSLKSGTRLLNAIAFHVDPTVWPNNRVARVYMAYRLEVNEYNHSRSLQLLVEHLEPA